MTDGFFLTQWFFLGMRWLCENVVSNDIFLTILISTVILRLLMLVSDIKQRKTAIKTAALQPQIAKLQERYKDNPQKLQQEQQKLMKESGVSMFGGCLPMILTLVLLFCFISAFRSWGYEQNVKVLDEMSENIASVMYEEKDAFNTAIDSVNSKNAALGTKTNAQDIDKEDSDSASSDNASTNATASDAVTSDKADMASSDQAGSDMTSSDDVSESEDAKTDEKADEKDDEEFVELEKITDETSVADCIKLLAALDDDDPEQKEIKEAILSKVEISETFNNSKFLWINNIWQPDNGFSPVVIPDSTFFGTNYNDTKDLIYIEEHKDVEQKLIDLGIFYDEADEYSNANKEAMQEEAVRVYNVLMQPIANKYEKNNNGWFILPILSTTFQLLYVWYSQKSTAKAQTANADNQPGKGTSKIMLFLMPVLSFVFCLSYTSAFAIYWTLSSMIMLITNIILSMVMKKNKTKQTAK